MEHSVFRNDDKRYEEWLKNSCIKIELFWDDELINSFIRNYGLYCIGLNRDRFKNIYYIFHFGTEVIDPSKVSYYV